MYTVDASYIKMDQEEFQTMGHRYNLKKQRANKKQLQTFLTFHVVNSRNMLLSDVVEVTSLNTLKSK